MFKLKKIDTQKLGEKTKELMKRIGKRNLVIILAVILIGGAVWLNWTLFSGDKIGSEDTDVNAGNNTDTSGVNAEDTGDVDNANGNEGDSYFASAQVNRQRARDEALEVLRLIIDDSEAIAEAKDNAAAEISQIAIDIENEANIETLIIGKGFENCVAVINGSACNVIVKSDELLPNDLAQIQEIVYEQSGILPENVKITPKSE